MHKNERFRLTPEQFDIDNSGQLMLDTNQISSVAENTYESFLPVEDGVTVSIKIEF